MFNENEGGGDAPLSEEEAGKDLQVPVFADPASPTPEEALAAVEVAKSALAQKKHWRAKAQAAAPAPVVTPKAPDTGADAVKKIEEDVARLNQVEEKRSFGYDYKLSPEETDAVFAFAKGNGLATADALKHPFVKNGIEAMRREARNAANTPGSSHRAPTVEGKTIGQMNRDERKKNFGAIVESATGH